MTGDNMSEYTWIEDDVCVCNNCGAHASSEKKVKHYKTCRAGESKRWENFYNQNQEESCF